MSFSLISKKEKHWKLCHISKFDFSATLLTKANRGVHPLPYKSSNPPLFPDTGVLNSTLPDTSRNGNWILDNICMTCTNVGTSTILINI
jgi:hypothetical protein